MHWRSLCHIQGAPVGACQSNRCDSRDVMAHVRSRHRQQGSSIHFNRVTGVADVQYTWFLMSSNFFRTSPGERSSSSAMLFCFAVGSWENCSHRSPSITSFTCAQTQARRHTITTTNSSCAWTCDTKSLHAHPADRIAPTFIGFA